MFRAALYYFGIVFTVGFILGTVRVLAMIPLVGERYAELIEFPFMLTAIFFASKFVAKPFQTQRISTSLAIGLIALCLLLSVEFTVVLTLRELTIEEYFQAQDPVAGIAYLFGLIFFAVAPVLQCHLSNRRATSSPP